ncbi:hypothetical protein [Streptomyces sp. NPDC051129]|uniref:hypothetical protein n=1 Tax=Streptomyces sp. NPDC051129 TaxID=3154639 RepID=UPI003420BDED
MDTRTGELPDYLCPPHLLPPAVVEEWCSPEELDTLTDGDAMIRAWCRWRDARDEWTIEQTDDSPHLRMRVAQLCGSGGRPVWRDELGQPWHARQH